MTQLEDFYIPLRLTGFAVWLLSCVLATVVLLRSGQSDRLSIGRLAAVYLVSGGVGIAVTVAALGQHYSYTDVVMNGVPLGFDLDFFVRHVGLAVIGAWLVWRFAAQRQALRWWGVVLAPLAELLVRADNTGLLVWLDPSLQEGGLAGAVLPPLAGAVGIIAVSERYRSTIAKPRGA